MNDDDRRILGDSRARRNALALVLAATLVVSCGSASRSARTATSSPFSAPAAGSHVLATPPAAALASTPPTAVPSLPLHVYVVASGDTFWSVARHFGVPIDQLLDVNPAIDDPDAISVGQEIFIPVVPWRPLVLESAVGSGPFDTKDKRALLGEWVTIRILADLAMAGEEVEWFTDWDPGIPLRLERGGYGSNSISADGVASTGEQVSEHARVAWQGRLAATAIHGELWSDSLIVEWGGTGPCPASHTGQKWRAESPDGTVYEAISGIDAGWNARATIIASNLGGSTGTGWRHELAACKEPMDVVFAADGTAYVTILDLPYSDYALDAVVLVFGPERSTPRASVPTTGSYGSRGPGLFLSRDGTVYMFTYDGEYDMNVYRSMSLKALDSTGRPKPGWPYTSTDRGSDPAFGPDGTVYLGFWTEDRDRVVALDPAGRMKPGWPFLLPAGSSIPDLSGCVSGEMCGVEMERPAPPGIDPDGTIVVAGGDTTYRIRPDGTLEPG